MDPRMDDDDPLVRPYAITGGRTRPRVDIAIESLIRTTEIGGWAAARLGGHRRGVLALCAEVQSLAEVSARLDLHLGVARVIVGDLAADGMVEVLRTSDPADDGLGVYLLERVLSGLRKL